jgi:murein L,D-transpeptidase YafK
MKINSVSLSLLVVFLFTTTNSFVIIKKKKAKKKSAKTTTLAKKAAKPYYDTNYLVMVDKSDYELKVYDSNGWLATYPVVFGNKSLSDKKMEGDRCTPEGTFRITYKNPNHKWDKFMQFDYPTAESYEKFNERKRNGEIPPDAKIGGGVGIHGTWPGSEHVVDNYINWTEGCISMKNEDIEELFTTIPMYTKIVIQP